MGNPVDLSEFVFVPRYNVATAAGYGAPVFGEEPLFCLAFRKYWIDNYVTKQPEKLSVITVKGDSMEVCSIMGIPFSSITPKPTRVTAYMSCV